MGCHGQITGLMPSVTTLGSIHDWLFSCDGRRFQQVDDSASDSYKTVNISATCISSCTRIARVNVSRSLCRLCSLCTLGHGAWSICVLSSTQITGGKCTFCPSNDALLRFDLKQRNSRSARSSRHFLRGTISPSAWRETLGKRQGLSQSSPKAQQKRPSPALSCPDRPRAPVS